MLKLRDVASVNIAFLTTMKGVPWGGSELLWAAAAKSALGQGHNVLMVVFDWSEAQPPVAQLLEAGASVIARKRMVSRALWRRALRRIGFERWVSRWEQQWVTRLRKWSPDVVCISQGNTYEVFHDTGTLQLLRQTERPVVHICHLNNEFHVPSDNLQIQARNSFKKAARVLFVARENMEAAERQLATRFVNALVVRNPVNLFGWAEYPDYPHAARDHLCLAVVARLDVKYKGHDLLLKVLSDSKWKKRSWSLHIYGKGKDDAYIRQLIDLYGLADKVEMVGHVDDVKSIWAENHLLVLPSRAEGTPLALVEAMLMARPAVVTDVGGHAEWVAEGENGFLAEGFTVRSIGAAMERAWKIRDRLERMGEKAREFALNNVDADPGGTLVSILGEAAESSKATVM